MLLQTADRALPLFFLSFYFFPLHGRLSVCVLSIPTDPWRMWMAPAVVGMGRGAWVGQLVCSASTSKQKQTQRKQRACSPPLGSRSLLSSPPIFWPSILHLPSNSCNWCIFSVFLLLTTITATCERFTSGLQHFIPGRASLLLLLDFASPPHKHKQQQQQQQLSVIRP